ncbi:hypothetical protein HYU23_02725 [Candidatus Woesearchaeota archaeon]|nr:hypothetical protein [Candidatus Woesearchaeota archaeon]
MVNDTSLLDRLKRDRFNGRELVWEAGSYGAFGNIPLLVAADDNFYYLRDGERIFAQSKDGNAATGYVPFCYQCNTEAKVWVRYSPTVTGIHPGENFE